LVPPTYAITIPSFEANALSSYVPPPVFLPTSKTYVLYSEALAPAVEVTAFDPSRSNAYA
jgi:hypothetical protein